MKKLLCLVFGHRSSPSQDPRFPHVQQCTRCEKAILHHPSGTEYALSTTWQENLDLYRQVFPPRN